MSRFSDCFLLVFGQLAVGGMVGLAVPPFAVLERGFYKSSAAVFLGCALLFLGGKVALLARGAGAPGSRLVEIALWAGFSGAIGLYLTSLWGHAIRLRARAYTAALATGLLALVASASAYRLGPPLGPAAVLYPLAFLTGALALGGVAVGMLLGHWYLIDVGLSIEPLRRLFHYFVAVLIAHLAVMLATVATLAARPGPGAVAVAVLWGDHAGLLASRVLLGPVAALAIAWMIHRTLRIPQTMAATGLFYIAILAVMVGELLGRLILFRTSLPL